MKPDLKVSLRGSTVGNPLNFPLCSSVASVVTILLLVFNDGTFGTYGNFGNPLGLPLILLNTN
jgi:hypothetical protein